MKISNSHSFKLLFLMIAPLLGACGGSEDSNTKSHPWYSNGYLFERIDIFDSSGNLESSTNCSWQPQGRKLNCIEVNHISPEYSGYTHQDTFNSDGRIEQVTEHEPDANLPHFLAQRSYSSNKLVQEIRSNPASESTMFETINYNWDGEAHISTEYYEGPENNLMETLVARNVISWSDSRIQAITPDNASLVPSFHNKNASFSYDDKNRVEVYSSSNWDSTTWVESASTIYHYDDDNNVNRIEFFNPDGGLDGYSTLKYQYIGQVAENGPLTLGSETE